MKRIPLFLAGSLLLSGCATPIRHPVAQQLLHRGAEPEYVEIEDQDHEMHRAVHKARHTVGMFIAALKNPGSDDRDFEVKKPFVQNGKVEHIWLSNVHFSGNRFHGMVDNQPVKIKGLKMGERVSVNPEEISDWAFVRHGQLVGGYTIRVLCSKLSPERRKELEKEANFHIGR